MKKNTLTKLGTLIYGTVLLSVSFMSNAAEANTFSDYQLRRLLDPTESEMRAETKGRIYIYDGMTAAQVDEALDNNFDRMDAMMFTGIVQVDENGEQYVEEDGCD
jgi:hypothetical protein